MKDIRRTLIRILFSFILRDNIKCARALGVRIGERCCVLDEAGRVFGTEPWLITIGNHVEITNGVRFVTHEGALWCVRDIDESMENADEFRPIRVGNNVMIGMNVFIMPGVTIGNNVIVGAHSVVTKDVPDNTIVAGVPAKQISTMDGFVEKMKSSAFVMKTKNMDLQQKQKVIKDKYPEWFTDNGNIR